MIIRHLDPWGFGLIAKRCEGQQPACDFHLDPIHPRPQTNSAKESGTHKPSTPKRSAPDAARRTLARGFCHPVRRFTSAAIQTMPSRLSHK